MSYVKSVQNGNIDIDAIRNRMLLTLERYGFGQVESAFSQLGRLGFRWLYFSNRCSQRVARRNKENSHNSDKSKNSDLLLNNPVFKAVFEQDHQTLNDWLASGHDPNIVDEYGRAPLFYAASRGDTKAMSILLAYGANVNQCDVKMMRAFEIACINSHFSAARMLIEAGAPVDWPNNEGDCLSHLAAERGRADILGFLALNGADLNRQNNDGDTPIHIAVADNHPQAVETLLSNGASFVITNKENLDAFEIAVMLRKYKIIEIIARYVGLDINEIYGRKSVSKQNESNRSY